MADDPVGTVRVHPADDPTDPDARRVIRVDRPVPLRWQLITGVDGGRPGADWHSRSDAEIGLGPFPNGRPEWPVQDLRALGVVLGHHAPATPPDAAPTAVIEALVDAVLALAAARSSHLAPHLEDLTEALDGLLAVLDHLPRTTPPEAPRDQS